MPQPVLTKYKQGDLAEDYPKKIDKMKDLNLNREADPSISTKDYPTKKQKQVEESFFKMANEKDY
jgi:hypothetical protein|tara:strand:- start:344 stop:538 length:195 start_codon:yes stop_codon:yes gene_type:complete